MNYIKSNSYNINDAYTFCFINNLDFNLQSGVVQQF